MLHLILGGAGSGKSTCLTEMIAHDVKQAKKCWLIIPEQQANLSERTILPTLPTGAGLSFSIAGFSRLYREVTDRFGGGAQSTLPRPITTLFMWQNLREMTGLLQEYGTTSPRSDAHLTSLLLKTVDELQQNAISPLALERAAEKLPQDSALRPKLADLALLYAAYDNLLRESLDGASPDELTRLAEILDEHNYFDGGNVYIDSFTDFTAAEYAIVRAMLRQADHVTITLCLDKTLATQPSHDGPADTYRRLLRLCDEEHVEVVCHNMEDNRRTASHELHILERSLWDLSLAPDARKIPDESERGNISLLRCTNVYAEAEATALHILDLMHQGYRYGDMAVVVRDAKTYRGVLDAAMERYGIPFYFSEKTALSDKPLSRLLISALRAVAHGWQAQDIMSLLKTGLCPVSSRDLDLFEQYVSTWNINGRDFAAPAWNKNPDGYTDRLSSRGKDILEAANRVREAVMPPLLRLYAATAKAAPLPRLCAALYDFMTDLSLSDRCAELAHNELAAGYLKQAGETLRIYDTVLLTLTQISAYLPDVTLDAEELATALSMVFAETEIASVPSLHDSVTVGSADTLRVENVKISFLLGLNEGEFPKAVSDEGLLGDAEKQLLSDLGIALDDRNELRASKELLFVWRAMTKPSDRLFVSTLLSSTDGKEKTPSVAYNRLLFLFPYLKHTVRDFDLSMITPKKEAQDAPAQAVPLSEDLDGALGAAPDTAPDDGLYQSLSPSENDLSPAARALCFGDTLWLSQSTIQTFVQCPYRYFCTYHLAPRERGIARVDAADSGTFLHYLLEQFLRRCLDEEGTFHLPHEASVGPLADRLVNGYLRNLGAATPLGLRTLHVFRRLRTLTLVLLRDILHELSHSQFSPRAFELNIGGKTPDAPPPYEVALDEGHRILLTGKIDRVDFYRRGDDIYLRVIDYKSSAHDISLDELRHGLNLQLLIYLFALCRPEHIHPAGALYVAAAETAGRPTPDRAGLLLGDEDILTAMNDELDPLYLAGISRTKSGSLSGKALTDEEALAALEQDIRETLTRIGLDMLCGRAPRTPSADACRYCSIKDACPEAVREKQY
jgi:ATP-dependent helicase/nuclease subunit B